MKCKWAVMSTITSTREPSSWLLCSQIDELFLRHCPLLTTLGSAMPSLGWGPVEGSWRVGGEHPPWQRSAPELAVPDIPAWTSASAGLRSPAPPASSLAVWSSEDARAQLAAGMESRAAVLTSSRDPRPVGYPGKLWWDRGRLDVSRDRSQGMGPLPGNSGACVIFVVRELAGRKMLAFPGNTATQHICYCSTRG